MRTIYAGQCTSPQIEICTKIVRAEMYKHPTMAPTVTQHKYNRMSMGRCVPGGQKEKIGTEIPQRVTIRSNGRMEKNSNFKNTEFVSYDAKTVTRTQKDAWKCNKILTLSLTRGTYTPKH